MISISTVDLGAWLAAFLWPFVRILGLFTSAPLFNDQGIPAQLKIGLAIAISVAVSPVLPAMPAIDPGSASGLLILVNQFLVGLAIGFAMRLVFAATEMAGELIGLQMGLGFASLYNPQDNADNPVLAVLFSLTATLVFLALNGHLMLITVLTRSFELIPIAPGPLPGQIFQTLAGWGVKIFVSGFFLALPLVAALLIANLALGILSRAAPQLNLFAIGFPLLLGIGLLVLMVAMPYFVPAFERLFEEGFDSMLRMLDGAPPLVTGR